MDEYKEINTRFKDYLARLGNLFEIGIDKISQTKSELDDFISDYRSFYKKIDVPSTNPDLLKTIKEEIDNFEKIIEINKKELDEVKREKEQLYKSLISERKKIKIQNDDLKSNYVKGELSYTDYYKQKEDLKKKYNEITDKLFILRNGGKYENIATKDAQKSIPDNSPLVPEPPKKKPIVENSITYYQQKGILPNNIKPSIWQKLCAELGLDIKNTKVAIKVEDLERLKHSRLVHEASVKASIETKHKKVVSEYDKMIAKYKKLSSDMNGMFESFKGKEAATTSDLASLIQYDTNHDVIMKNTLS